MVYERTELIGVYPYFSTASDASGASFSVTYGNEIDLMAKQKIHKNFDLVAAFAFYVKGDDDGTNFTADETVFRLRGTFRF